MKNKKLQIGIVILAAILLTAAIVFSVFGKKEKNREPESSALESSRIEWTASSEKEKTSSSTETLASRGMVESSGSENASLPTVSSSLSSETQEENMADILIAQSADQILTLGGPWTYEKDPSVFMRFASGEVSVTTYEGTLKTKYEVKAAQFESPSDNARSVYRVFMKDGTQMDISCYEGNKYILSPVPDKPYVSLPEGIDGSVGFIKTAEIVLGNQKNENGLTDEQRDESGVTYLDDDPES